MSKVLLVVVSLLGLSVAACAADEQTVKPFKDGETRDYGDDDNDAPRAKSTKSSAKSSDSAPTKSNVTSPKTTLAIDTSSCNGVTEPELSYTFAGAGTLPAASGGTITDGTWVQQSAELENAAGVQLTDKRHGMIRFSGNRFAWHDTSACMTGTFTTDGSTLSFATEDGTASVTFSAESGGGFTLKRSADEAYHYVKE